MKNNLLILVLCVLSILSVSYSVFLHNECRAYRNLSSQYTKEIDSLRTELIFKQANDEYIKSQVEAVYAKAKEEFEKSLVKK